MEGGGDLVRVGAVKALQRRAEYVLIIKHILLYKIDVKMVFILENQYNFTAIFKFELKKKMLTSYQQNMTKSTLIYVVL